MKVTGTIDTVFVMALPTQAQRENRLGSGSEMRVSKDGRWMNSTCDFARMQPDSLLFSVIQKAKPDAPANERMIVGQTLDVNLAADISPQELPETSIDFDRVECSTRITFHKLPPGGVVIFRSRVSDETQSHVTDLKALIEDFNRPGK